MLIHLPKPSPSSFRFLLSDAHYEYSAHWIDSFEQTEHRESLDAIHRPERSVEEFSKDFVHS